MPSPLAPGLTRRLVLKAAGGVGLVLSGCQCGEGAVPLLVDEPQPPYPLDTDGDEMPILPASYFNKLYDPLLLYGQCVVGPNGNSAPNTAALSNPHNMSMELLEIRWQIYPNNTLTNFSTAITGMGIGAKIDLGDIPIVDANVPLNMFGNARDDDDLDPGVNQVAVAPDPDEPTVLAVPNSYRWRLKHPLMIPAGCVLTPLYSHLGQNHFPVVVDTLYICRTLPTGWVMPASFKVPWAGSYNSVSFDNLADEPAGRDFSSELDIVNPFAQPLELSRISGRCAAVFNGIALSTQNGVTSRTFIAEDITDHRFRLGKVRMRARAGDELARTPTPFNGLFPTGWRTWDIPSGWTMRPGEFYKVQLTVAATGATAPSDEELGTIQYSMAGVGYRTLDHATFTTAARGSNP